MKKALLSLSLIVIAAFAASAQEVIDKSYVTKTGEKVLRFEATLPVDAKRVWRAFSDPEDMKGWIAPFIQLDLRIGGTLLTNYDKTAKITKTADCGDVKAAGGHEGQVWAVTFSAALEDVQRAFCWPTHCPSITMPMFWIDLSSPPQRWPMAAS